MKIQLLYFDGCPSHERALENLKTALSREGQAEAIGLIELVEVTSEADARARRFVGSPSIRLDDVDLEGPDAESRGYGFGCRVYADGPAMAGWPSVERIQAAIRLARSRDSR